MSLDSKTSCQRCVDWIYKLRMRRTTASVSTGDEGVKVRLPAKEPTELSHSIVCIAEESDVVRRLLTQRRPLCPRVRPCLSAAVATSLCKWPNELAVDEKSRRACVDKAWKERKRVYLQARADDDQQVARSKVVGHEFSKPPWQRLVKEGDVGLD